jgi:hypothetical protein
MRYSPFFTGIALPLLLIAASPATAGPITYNIDDYSAQGVQDNTFGTVLLTGSITTDGTTGIGLTDPKIITGWTLTFTQGATSITIKSADADTGQFIQGAGLDITRTAITLSGADSRLELQDLHIVGELRLDIMVWASNLYEHIDELGVLTTPDQWVDKTPQFGPPTFAPIAEAPSVPEPASLTLVLAGVGALAGAGFVRRRRQPAPSQRVRGVWV